MSTGRTGSHRNKRIAAAYLNRCGGIVVEDHSTINQAIIINKDHKPAICVCCDLISILRLPGKTGQVCQRNLSIVYRYSAYLKASHSIISTACCPREYYSYIG